MINVLLTEQEQVSLPKSEEGFFLEVCKAHNITCEKNQMGDYVLLPPLNGKSVMLYSLNHADKEEDLALRRLAEMLSSQGALVLYSSPGSLRNDIMKILGIQIIISFAPEHKREVKEQICFFYSLKKKKESLKVIASIIKQLARENNLLYKIANFIDFMVYCKHNKLFLADIPTVLIQLNDLNSGERGYLEKALVCALLEFYGKKPLVEQLQWVKDLIEDLQKKVQLEDEEKQIVATNLVELNIIETLSDQENEDEEALEAEEFLPVTAITETQIIEVTENSSKGNGQLTKGLIEKKVAKAINTQKNSPKKVRKSLLYPPADGPIFQFAVPVGNNYVYEYPRTNSDASCKAAIANLDLDYHKAPPKPWEFAQVKGLQQDPEYYPRYGSTSSIISKEYNALKDLKNLAEIMAKSERLE